LNNEHQPEDRQDLPDPAHEDEIDDLALQFELGHEFDPFLTPPPPHSTPAESRVPAHQPLSHLAHINQYRRETAEALVRLRPGAGFRLAAAKKNIQSTFHPIQTPDSMRKFRKTTSYFFRHDTIYRALTGVHTILLLMGSSSRKERMTELAAERVELLFSEITVVWRGVDLS
jgi:hypothetical protein